MTKLQLRRAWFQVHKWIGLILAILIIPLSLSGALLVWDKPVDRLLNPARYATTGTAQLPLDAYLSAARKALPADAPIARVFKPGGSARVRPAEKVSASAAIVVGKKARLIAFCSTSWSRFADTRRSLASPGRRAKGLASGRR